jgi:hypothetical protein
MNDCWKRPALVKSVCIVKALHLLQVVSFIVKNMLHQGCPAQERGKHRLRPVIPRRAIKPTSNAV